jgi:predicted transcriptional regulator
VEKITNMAAITFEISDHQLEKLQDLARLHDISPAELLSASFDDLLSPQKSEFTTAIDYILEKNFELYQRLA